MKSYTVSSLLKTLFFSKDFLAVHQNKQRCDNCFLGSRKGHYVYDVERAFNFYLKALNLIRCLKRKRLSVLYIGCPSRIKKRLSILLDGSSHVYTDPASWRETKQPVHDLIVVYCSSTIFSNSDVLQMGAPSIFFDSGMFDHVTKMDFPVELNMESTSIEDMYLHLVKCLGPK